MQGVWAPGGLIGHSITSLIIHARQRGPPTLIRTLAPDMAAVIDLFVTAFDAANSPHSVSLLAMRCRI